MTRPSRFILRMAVFLVAIGAAIAPLAPGLLSAFQYNPGLNGLVVGIFIAGIAINFRQVFLLKPECEWLDGLRRQTMPSGDRLRLLAPLANMLGDDMDRVSISAVTLRSLLDSISARLDEQRDLGRYFVGLLIFLGLLGTFWGLSHAVGSMGQVIRSLTLAGGDASAAFEKLKSGMEAPLGGMGMAFSTSLFGLAGSLILGFLDLQAGQAQNAFFNELEEWLAGQTQLGGPATAAPPSPSSVASTAYLHALLERASERLDELGKAMIVTEQSRQETHHLMEAMTHRLGTVADLIRADQSLIARMGETDMQVQPLMTRLVDETIKSREYVVSELQAEFRLLARTLSASDEAPPHTSFFGADGGN